MSLRSRLLRTPRDHALPLIGLFLVCLLCQTDVATAAAHHADSSESHRACATVAEIAPVSPIDRLVGSFTTVGQPHVSVVGLPFLAGLWGAANLSGSRGPQSDALLHTRAPERYCLNCTYRL
ncbi:MAG: hypothetical protein ACOYXU_00680 [Nitrospirota bacterium]